MNKPCESNINTFAEKHVSSENIHCDNVAEMMKVVLPEVSQRNGSVIKVKK